MDQIIRTSLADYVIPKENPNEKRILLEKGTKVILSVYSIHRNPKFYPDPDIFDPERFSSENKPQIQPYSFIPFGVGPKQCIGNAITSFSLIFDFIKFVGLKLALMIEKIILVHILMKYSFKVTDKTEIPMPLSKKMFVLSPKNGVWLKLEERKISKT